MQNVFSAPFRAAPRMRAALGLCLASACWTATPEHRAQDDDGGKHAHTMSPAQASDDAGKGKDLDAGPMSDADAQVIEPGKPAACDAPLPATLPPSPSAQPSALAPLACAGAGEVVRCDDTLPCTSFGVCLNVAAGAQGVCVANLDLLPCASGGVPIGFDAGRCVRCVSPETRRALCCAGIPGVACDPPAKPEAKAQPGELCRVHGDCSPGLLCLGRADQAWGEHTGRCLCPNVDANSVQDPAECAAPSIPKPWGTASERHDSGCFPALSSGWSYEVVANAVDDFAVTIDGKAQVHLALVESFDAQGQWLNAQRISHLFVRDGAWTSEDIPDLLGNNTNPGVDIAADSQGHLHVVRGADMGSYARYASNASGAWVSEPVGTSSGDGPGAQAPSLLIDADDTVHVSYVDRNPFNLHHAQRGASGFVDQIISDDASDLNTFAFVRAAGSLTWLYTQNFAKKLERSVLGAKGVVTDDLTFGLDPVAVSSPTGLTYAYELFDDNQTTVSEVRLVRAGENQRIWLLDDLRYQRLSPAPSLALDGTGKTWLAHSTPGGLVLQEPNATGWTERPIISDDAPAVLLLDPSDQPHLFFFLTITPPDGFRTSLYQVIHAFRGSCPKP